MLSMKSDIEYNKNDKKNSIAVKMYASNGIWRWKTRNSINIEIVTNKNPLDFFIRYPFLCLLL